MIQVNELTKTFKKTIKEKGIRGSLKALFNAKYETFTAVDKVSFDISQAEILGFIGPNGAGKSTTIKMLTGIITPTSGSCTVNGKTPHKERNSYVKDIGVVFGQRTQLWWDLPLQETFFVLKEIYEVSDSDFKERMATLTEVLGLDEFIKSPVRTLSLGQRMRADFATSMLHNPKILFLDEPTIGLDVVVKDSIRKIIRHFNKEYGTTIILTTHDLKDIEELSTRILMIDKGKIIYNGTTDDIKRRYSTTKEISFVVEKQNNELNFSEHFKLPSEDLSHSINDGKHIVKYNSQKLPEREILSYTMGCADISDIVIKDTEIEEIVRKIYVSEKEDI